MRRIPFEPRTKTRRRPAAKVEASQTFSVVNGAPRAEVVAAFDRHFDAALDCMAAMYPNPVNSAAASRSTGESSPGHPPEPCPERGLAKAVTAFVRTARGWLRAILCCSGGRK